MATKNINKLEREAIDRLQFDLIGDRITDAGVRTWVENLVRNTEYARTGEITETGYEKYDTPEKRSYHRQMDEAVITLALELTRYRKGELGTNLLGAVAEHDARMENARFTLTYGVF